jgi:hypothetical protein
MLTILKGIIGGLTRPNQMVPIFGVMVFPTPTGLMITGKR